MDPELNFLQQQTRPGLSLFRRAFLGRSVVSLGAMALGAMTRHDTALAIGNDTAPRIAGNESIGVGGHVNPLHVMPRAKRVIFLCMAGGPSHLETFDFKPQLAALNGQPMPESFTAGQPIAQLQGQTLNCLGPQHPFGRFGSSGQQMSTVFRNIAGIADEMCIVRSVRTEQINHDPAHTYMNTGTAISGRPSMGSWVVYGLGRMADNLPGFVVLTSHGGGQDQPIAARQWHSGFLPSEFQGVQFQSVGSPVLYARRPQGVSENDQRRIVSAIQELNRIYGDSQADAEATTRIAQYEMAFQMQSSVPGLMDFSDEPQAILDMYGTQGGDGSFAGNCLLARRLAERGVRFIQLYHRGWDHHGGVKEGVEVAAGHVDRASAALVRDLRQRGMLDDTLVVWSGEFGRTPMAQGSGRDHHIKGFSLWMAGGGVRAGTSYGATDELGYNAVENVFHVHDLHATMLHLLGLDHQQLTFPFQGRDFRLTDVAGRVVHEVMA